MAPDTEGPREAPSPWELYRLFRKIDTTLDSLHTRYVSQEVFRAFQDVQLEAIRALTRSLGEERAEAKVTHAQLDTKIERYHEDAKRANKEQDERSEQIEKEARAQRQRGWLAVGVASLGAVLSFATALILRAIGS